MITKIEGKKPGAAVAIFGGVHGDEPVGAMVVDHLRKNLKIVSGTVYLVTANPAALEKEVRFTEKNLNRCFLESSQNRATYEEKRATELMDVLDGCDALLDLHAYTEEVGEARPFAITEKNAHDIVRGFAIDFVVGNIDMVEKGGSDTYMFNKGKVGICVELGAKHKPEKFFDLGLRTAHHFLQHFGVAKQQDIPAEVEQQHLTVTGKHIRSNEVFTYAKAFETFERLAAGTHICTDGMQEVFANEDLYILFPGALDPVGVPAFITAKATD